MYRIGIDPGHGGEDPGAIGPTRLLEKDVNLDIAYALYNFLLSRKFCVQMTRYHDITESLLSRSCQINNWKCHYCISIHCNASENRNANYIATFIQGRGGEAEKLAEKVQKELVQVTGWPDGGVRVQNLHMTRETKMPAILVECGFISNPQQEKQLADPFFRRGIGEAIGRGILNYLGFGKDGNGYMDVKVIVHGKEITGKLIDGKTYVHIRDIVEALNNTVLWDEKDKIVIVK